MRAIAVCAALIFFLCAPGWTADNAAKDTAVGAKKESGKVSKNGQKGKEEPVLLKKAGEAGQEFKKAGKAVGDAVLEGGEKAGQGIKKGGKAVGDAVHEGGEKAGQGIKKGGEAAGDWFSNASRKTGDTLNSWGRSIKRFFKGDSGKNDSK